MGIITIFLFFVYCYGLGFAVTSFAKNSGNFLERNLMRIGFGLALLPLIGLILNIIRVPIDWKIILLVSLAYPVFYIAKNRPKPELKFKITRTDLSILAMLVIFFANLYIYASGAFSYPFLEDDDSWSHALGAKFVAQEKTAFAGEDSPFHYLDPYPPAYDMLMGILHQTNDSMYFTLKFFNALIISLSTIFFYFFVREFTGNRNKALFAAFALLSIPAFMSHFIWALSLTMPLFFVVFYAMEMMKHDSRWWIVAALSMVTALTSSPTHSVYFGLFFVLYYLAKIILERKLLPWHASAGILGLALSFILWWGPMLLKYGFVGTIKGIGFDVGLLKEQGLEVALRGTGRQLYTFSDFFIAQKQNMINNPIGIGIFLSILAIIGIAFLLLRYKHLLKKENHWMIIALVWFAFTLYAVNGERFTLKISPFRAWMLLAIPVCILAAEGAFNLMAISKKHIRNIGKYSVLAILLVGIFFTSTQQKIAVNTAAWPPGAFWTSGDEIAAYVWMKDNLPRNSNVFTFWNNAPVVGMDMYTCHWCENIKTYMKDGFDQNAEELHGWLRQNNYGYIIFDGQTAQGLGVNETNAKVYEISQSGLFQPVFQNNGAVIFRV